MNKKRIRRRSQSGALGMKEGDRVRDRLSGRTGVAKEFLQDGDACVDWDDGASGMVKWNHLEKER